MNFPIQLWLHRRPDPVELLSTLHPRQAINRFVHHLIHLRETLLDNGNFFAGQLPVLAVDGLTHTGDRFNAVAGIEPRSVDLMLVPFAVRQAFGAGEHALSLH